MREPVPGIEAIPDNSNARYFYVHVDGPKDVSRFDRPSPCGLGDNLIILCSYRLLKYDLSNGRFLVGCCHSHRLKEELSN